MALNTSSGSHQIAVVTGSNKGIGYAIVKKLCREMKGTVYLTARNEELGKRALEQLKSECPGSKAEIRFHRLDISDSSTVNSLKDHLLKEHGGLDILVNNAGIAYKGNSTAPFSEQAEVTVGVNYFDTKTVCDILFPILKPHSRVVNISSQAGLLRQLKDDALKSKFASDCLTTEELSKLMQTFVELTKTDKHQDGGYSNSAYGMSKVAVTALTKCQQRSFDKDSRPDIIVNACCPGLVATDMNSKGNITPDEGAETPVYLALLPKNASGPKGALVFLKQEKDWVKGEPTW